MHLLSVFSSSFSSLQKWHLCRPELSFCSLVPGLVTSPLPGACWFTRSSHIHRFLMASCCNLIDSCSINLSRQ